MKSGRISLLLVATLPLILLLGFALFLAVCGERGCSSEPLIISFEECVAAGYPVMESYPRRCRAGEGKTFTEQIERQNVDEPEQVSIEGRVERVESSSRSVFLEGEPVVQASVSEDAMLTDARGRPILLRDIASGMTVRVSGTQIGEVILVRELRVVEVTD